jgi:transcription elongation factor GreB
LDHNSAYISVDSPVAKALLKKQEDDDVTIRLAAGEKTYTIDSIEYHPIPSL